MRRSQLAVVCVAQFVVVLDVTIVAIALPAIRQSLGMSVVDLEWVIIGYVTPYAGLLLLAGRLTDVLGARRLFAAGLAGFGLASLACGFAAEPWQLFAGRAVQGCAAAAVSPAALALLARHVPTGPHRQRAYGWWTAAAAGGGASGWVLGGLLTAAAGWRAVFLVVVPVAAAGLLGVRLFAPDGPAAGLRALDPVSSAAVTAALGLLVLGLTRLEHASPASPSVLVPLGAAALLTPLAARRERRSRHPLLPRVALRTPGMRPATLVALLLTAVTTPVMFLYLVHLQEGAGWSPALTGLATAPFNLAVVSGSLLAPRLRGAGERRLMAGGLAGIAAGSAVTATLPAGGAALLAVVAGLVLSGFGLGLASVASTGLGVDAAGTGEVGQASGLLTAAAQVGTALGLAVIVTLAVAVAEAPVGYRIGMFAAAGLAAVAGTILLAGRTVGSTRPARQGEHRPRSSCSAGN